MNAFSFIRYVPMWCLYLLAHFVSFIIRLRPHTGVMRVVHMNLQLAYPALSERERHVLANQAIRNQTLNMAESLKSWAMPPQWAIKQINTVHNQEILTQALANPNGMLAIVPHLGTWEMMNAWLNQFGSPTIMYKPVKGEKANQFVLQGRQRLNATLVPTDGSGVKAIFKTLKDGGFSIILPDHVPDLSGGVVVPFFGIPTLSSTLAPKLAIKTHCALVGLTCVRRDDGQGFDIYCDKLDNPALYDKNIEIATSALNDEIKTMTNRFPNQYMWGYKRFKHVPNYPNLYNDTADFNNLVAHLKRPQIP
nr:lysophospholipid acyltransferase family protein [uncultured Moraxella sp.]